MAIIDLHFKMVDKRVLITLHRGYMTWSHVFPPIKQNEYNSQQTQTCVPNREFPNIELFFFPQFIPVVEMVKMFQDF